MIKMLNDMVKLQELRIDFNYSSFKDEDMLDLCEAISRNSGVT